MTPKEKATEIFNKLHSRCTSYSSDRKNQKDNAKECALIVVREVTHQLSVVKSSTYDKQSINERINFFKQVKQEIEKL